MMRCVLALIGLIGVPSIAIATEPTLAEQLAAGRYQQVITAARERTGENVRDARAWLALGHALVATGKIDQARDAYQRARRGDGSLRLDARVALARIERVYRDVRAGKALLEEALAARENEAVLDVDERLAVGHAARDLARGNPALYDVALETYEAALESAPRDPTIHVAIGDLLLDRYNAEEAVDAYRAALEIAPEHAAAVLGLARARHFDGSPGIHETAERALTLNPNLVDALALIARLQIETEELTAARATVQRGLATNELHPQLLTLDAAITFLEADGSPFEKKVAEVRKLVPGYPRLFETLSEIAAQNRNYRRAADFALLAVTLDPSAWRAHAMLGRNRLRLGQMKPGRQSLETAFRGDPYDPWTRNTLALLDRMDGFETVRSKRFELVAERGEAQILAGRLLPIAERAFDFFSEAYQYAPRTPIRIEIFSRHEDFSVRTVGLTGIDIVGVSFGPVVAMDSPSAGMFGPLNFGSVLWHEIAHTFHLGLSETRVPRWFTEGLSVFEERRAGQGWGGDVSPGFLKAFRGGKLPPPSKLNEVFLRPSTPDALIHAYYQASLLIDFIVAEHGFEPIVEMLNAYGEGFDTHAAIERALMIAPRELDQRFERYVRARFATALTALTPPEPSARAPYPALLKDADEAIDDGALDRAVELLEQAQALFPEHAGLGATYIRLGELHEKRGDVARAIEQYRAGVAIDADDIRSLKRLIALYRSEKRDAEAAQAIEHALLITPFEAGLHRSLATLHESDEDWTKAARARAAVVSLDDTDPAEARFLLARAHHRAGDADAARAEVLKALEVAPMYEQALELLLRIRERAGAS